MALRVIGAGVGRTGTLSLKLALERLLGGRCYHMNEVFLHSGHSALWRGATRGCMPDWDAFFQGYPAAVDWPAAAFWRELMEAFPDALVLLSVRDAEAWWQSTHRTIFSPISFTAAPRQQLNAGHVSVDEIYALGHDLFAARFTPEVDNRVACLAAFERHNAQVRSGVPADRLIEWRPGDGWAPLCTALGVPVPPEPFPHVNTTDEFIGNYRVEDSQRLCR